MNKEEDWLTCKKRLSGGHGKVRRTVINGPIGFIEHLSICVCMLSSTWNSGLL